MTAKKHKLQKWIQSELIYAALDEINAVSINGFSLTDDESVKAVGKNLVADFIRLNMKSGLIEVSGTYKYGFEKLDGENLSAIFEDLSEDRFFKAVIWDVLHFTGTEKLEKMLAEREMLAWDALRYEVDQVFIDQLAEIYFSCFEGADSEILSHLI